MNGEDTRPRLSVVSPVFCEEFSIARALAGVAAVLERLGVPYELIVVDDGSTDRTWQVIREVARDRPRLRAIRLTRHFGKEAAIRAGIEAARGDAVIVMDADLQHPPELIPDMVRVWRDEGANIVEAVKEQRGREPWLATIGAGVFYALLSGLSHYDLRGSTDFKLMDRTVVNGLLRMGERGMFFRGMVAWLGFRRSQVRFKVPPGTRTPSRWGLVALIQLAFTAVTAFSSFPLRLVTIAGIVFAVFAVALGAQTIYVKLSGGAVTGFTTVILLILVVGSGIMVALGVIGEYLARIYEEVKGRPAYVLSETINSTGSPDEPGAYLPGTRMP